MSFDLAPAATPVWSAIVMPSGETTAAAASWRKPTEWRQGRLRVRLWYTSDVGAVANFSPEISVYAARGTEALPGTLLLNATLALAGPAVASTVVKSDHTYTTVSLGNDDEVFTVHVERPSSDTTNANEFQLLYVEVEHVPGQLEAE